MEVEEKLTGAQWKGDFQAKYVEDITQKAGCAKKFSVFFQMLVSAFKSSSSEVFIDLLTLGDLMKLKNLGQEVKDSNEKRYLILTY